VGAALRPEDAVWSQLDRFRRRVESALEAVRRAADIGPIGVAFSGGKDSVCVLDLVRRVVPDAPAALFDSGCELPETLSLATSMRVDIIRPRMSMLDMARYAGWWEYADPVDRGCAFDAKAVLIQEPSEAFVVTRRLRVLAYGVRGSESSARAVHAATRRELWQGADRTWYLMPLAAWDERDVWAYIASRELSYHPAYDAMAEADIPRRSQRVAQMLGERGSGWGRHALLRRYAPEAWRALAREFPALYRLS